VSTPNNNAVTAYQQQQQQALAQGSAGITKAFSGFTPAFYQGREQAYENYALPQLGQQYRETYNQLNSGLADQGIIKGSAAGQLNQALQETNAQQEEQIANTAQTQAQNLQQTVAGQESELYGELQESLNPTATTQNAVNLAAQTAAPSVFAPLGQAFTGFANQYLAKNASNTYNPITASYLYNPFYLSGATAGSGAAPANPLA
jgi:hypothetical protein